MLHIIRRRRIRCSADAGNYSWPRGATAINSQFRGETSAESKVLGLARTKLGLEGHSNSIRELCVELQRSIFNTPRPCFLLRYPIYARRESLRLYYEYPRFTKTYPTFPPRFFFFFSSKQSTEREREREREERLRQSRLYGEMHTRGGGGCVGGRRHAPASKRCTRRG